MQIKCHAAGQACAISAWVFGSGIEFEALYCRRVQPRDVGSKSGGSQQAKVSPETAKEVAAAQEALMKAFDACPRGVLLSCLQVRPCACYSISLPLDLSGAESGPAPGLGAVGVTSASVSGLWWRSASIDTRLL